MAITAINHLVHLEGQMRILSILANSSGSSWYRQAIPMRAMQAAGYPVTIIAGGSIPEGLLQPGDVIQLSRVSMQVDQIIDHIRTVQARGVRVVIDFDDDLISIPEHNPAHRNVDPQDVIKAVRAADAIVVTNDALASVYRPYAKRLAVIPNYADVANWPIPSRKGPLTIGLVGSPSHVEDWRYVAEPMRQIRKEFPNVLFVVAGFCPGYLEDVATQVLHWVPIDQYPAVVNCIDIGLAPLIDDAFNRRKSPIKALEYGLAGAAVVGSATQYLSVVKGRGTIARTEQEWYTAIETYITDPDKRRRDAQALRSYVIKNYDVRTHTKDIYNTYRRLFK